MKIKIIKNPTKEWAIGVAEEAKKILKEAGHEIVSKGADVTICIGGDGTILYAGHRKWLEGKILGIGSERSYICQLHKKNWKKQLLKLLNEKTDSIFILHYEIRKRGRLVLEGKAINDIVIHANNYRVLPLAISIGEKTSRIRADGVIVSSAIGSTGYAYSAGGKKLKPTSRKMDVVPIAPYRREYEATTIGPNSVVRIKAEKDCAFILDGIYIKELKPDETVIIRQDEALKFFKGVGWYEKR